MASVEVHVDTNSVELLHGVGDTGLVCILGTRALRDVQVGDQVGERIRLNDGDDTDLRVHCGQLVRQMKLWKVVMLTLDLGNKLVNVGLVVSKPVVGDAELSVGCKGSAITVWEIVDDNRHDVLVARGRLFGGGVSKVCTQGRGLSDDIEPGEGGDVGNTCSLGLQSGITDLTGSSLDLSCIVGRQVDLQGMSHIIMLNFCSIHTVYPLKGFPASGVVVGVGVVEEPPVDVGVDVVRVDEEVDDVLRVELLLLADPGL